MHDGLRRLRIRVTATAVAIVGVALVVAAFAIVSWVGRSLTQSVREAAQARTAQVADRIRVGDQTPVPADPQEETVQLLGPGDSLGPVTIEGDYLTETTDFVLPSGEHRMRSEEHKSELQSLRTLVCLLVLEKE